VRTDPLAAATVADGDQLGVVAVRGRRRSKFLRAEGRAGVPAVLAGTQLTAVGFELLAVLVRLSVHHALLGVTSCNSTVASNQYIILFIFTITNLIVNFSPRLSVLVIVYITSSLQ